MALLIGQEEAKRVLKEIEAPLTPKKIIAEKPEPPKTQEQKMFPSKFKEIKLVKIGGSIKAQYKNKLGKILNSPVVAVGGMPTNCGAIYVSSFPAWTNPGGEELKSIKRKINSVTWAIKVYMSRSGNNSCWTSVKSYTKEFIHDYEEMMLDAGWSHVETLESNRNPGTYITYACLHLKKDQMIHKGYGSSVA